VRVNRRLLLCLVWAAATLGIGCSRAVPDAPLSAGSSDGLKRYPVRGKVMGVNLTAGEVELDAAAIPGYMDAMTMPYRIKSPQVLGELHPGDAITATLVVGPTVPNQPSEYLDQIVVTSEAKLNYKPDAVYAPVTIGASVPDFKFRNQSDRTVDIAAFKGRVLLVTFVYTRCPLADYCPRMSRNFAAVDKLLAADAALYAKTHLLTISFDPTYDTPAVLRSYGGAYTGRYTQETFAHWDFAAPSPSELPDVLRFFDLGATAEKDKTITHSLSTVVISPDGKVLKWYPTNDWTPEQVLGDVKTALGARA
jgi:protein SCO1/2